MNGLHGLRDRDGLAARRRSAPEDGLLCAVSGPAPPGSTRGDQHQDDVGRCAPVVQSWTNRRDGVQSEGSWARCSGCREGAGLIQVIEKLRQARWVVQIQPAHHCLKPCGQSIHRGIGSLGSTPSPIAAATDEIAFLVAQHWIKLPKGLSLSLGADFGNNGTVQHICATGRPTETQSLVQLPDSIPQPGQLQRAEISSIIAAGLALDPLAQAARLLRAVGRS